MNKKFFYSPSLLSLANSATALLLNPFLVRNQRIIMSSLHSSNEADDEIDKWEKMYLEGEKLKLMSMEDNKSILETKLPTQDTGVAVITFDLDNTLWKTKEVIDHANKILSEYLTSQGIVQIKRTEKIMKDLFNEDPVRYNPLFDKDGNGNVAKSGNNPVFLSQLRTDAIARICMEDGNGYNETCARTFAQSAFDVWYNARHEAIPNHYVNNVVPVLNKLRSSDPKLIIGAITDGNSEPRNIKELSPIFDFVINAEVVGVSKPHRDIYYAAIEYVSKLPQVSDKFSSSSDNLEDSIGPWWVHVGDDFIKDVVAAKQFNMRSIWSRELIRTTQKSLTQQSQLDNKVQKDLQGFMEQISGKEVIQMQIGADDYLADSIRNEFVDASIDTFEDLVDLIESWQQISKANKVTLDDLDGVLEVININGDADYGLEPIFNPSVKTDIEEEGIVFVKKDKVILSENKSKFCIFCGTKLPIVAKFCISCGEKQPEILM